MIDNLSYPVIGTEVNYMRATPEGEIFEGVGIVKAIHLDPRNRLMVNVMDCDDGKAWNIDFVGVNYGDDMLDKYKHVIAEVSRITKEGNELVQKTVKSYNDDVEKLYSDVLGDPIHFETPEAPEQPTEQ